MANINVLVVAGGGGGGGSTAGGGGAGGYLYDSNFAVLAGDIAVTIGAGGAEALEKNLGNSGQDSVFDTKTAIGGGGGGYSGFLLAQAD